VLPYFIAMNNEFEFQRFISIYKMYPWLTKDRKNEGFLFYGQAYIVYCNCLCYLEKMWAKSPNFVNSALKIQCHIVKSTKYTPTNCFFGRFCQ